MSYYSNVTKEELDEVLKEFAPKFKHIEPHIIAAMYVFIKRRESEKIKSDSPTKISDGNNG